MPITNETILITGASSGIGRALALKLATHNQVLAVGRNINTLRQLASESNNIKPLVFDVSNKALIPEFQASLTLGIDRVILNAGDCEYLDPQNIDWEIFERMMAVNFFGWINTLKASLDRLCETKQPHIIGISSQVIFAPFSMAEAYGASKAASSYFLKSLSLDVRFKGIDVSLIQPGFVDTPLTQKNDFPMPYLMSADQAADRIINAISRRDLVYSFPKRLKTMLFLSKLAPKFWLKKMAWKHNEK